MMLLKLAFYMFTLQHLHVPVLWLCWRHKVHKPIINHAWVCLCAGEGVVNASEIRATEWDIHYMPHVERCEVNDVLCNNGSIFLPHLCCQNSQLLSALTHNASNLRTLQHWHYVTPKTFCFRGKCLCAESALSVYGHIVYLGGSDNRT